MYTLQFRAIKLTNLVGNLPFLHFKSMYKFVILNFVVIAELLKVRHGKIVVKIEPNLLLIFTRYCMALYNIIRKMEEIILNREAKLLLALDGCKSRCTVHIL